MQVAARVAKSGDLEALGLLYADFRDCVADERGGVLHLARAPATLAGSDLRRLWQDGGRLVLAGTIDDVPVGLGIARLDPLADGTLQATLEVLYVDKAAREVGVGECLVEAAAAWAAGAGAAGLDVPALPGMREAKNLFESLGFAARLIVMHKRLDAAGADRGQDSTVSVGDTTGSAASSSALSGEDAS